MYIFICENSPNGILTGVYDAWSLKIEKNCSHADIFLLSEQPDNYELFNEFYTVNPSPIKTEKVASTLRRKLGQDFYDKILSAILAVELSSKKKMDKANAVYQTIVTALHSPHGAKVLEHLGNPYIYRVFELSRATASEAHHLKGFLRFSELKMEFFSPGSTRKIMPCQSWQSTLRTVFLRKTFLFMMKTMILLHSIVPEVTISLQTLPGSIRSFS